MAPISSLSLSIGTPTSGARAAEFDEGQGQIRLVVGPPLRRRCVRSAWSSAARPSAHSDLAGTPVRCAKSTNAGGAPCVCADAEDVSLTQETVAEFGLTDSGCVFQHRLNTGSSSPGELEMTFSTSAVAVCCSNASDSCLRVSAFSRRSSRSCFSKSVRVEMRRLHGGA